MIPLVKISIDEQEIKEVEKVLRSGIIAQGPKVKEFEDRFAFFVGAKHAVAMNSGTAALHSALYAAGVGEGDEVITVPFTFVATVNSILMQRATPVFVDVDENTFNMDISRVEEKITKKTKAIIPVDLYGHPYDYDPLLKIAKKHGLKIIEDSCQAVNAEYHGKKCGKLGDIGVFSFYATKNLVTGEGGMLITDNDEYAESARRFRHHGQGGSRYDYFDLGFNYRTTDINAAIGLVQLGKIEKLTEQRIKNAEYLTKGFSKIKGIKTPITKKNCRHVFHQYTIVISKDFPASREEVTNALSKKKIGFGIYYPKPLHLFNHIKKFGFEEGDFPIAERLSNQVLSLPVHHELKKEEMDIIIGEFSRLCNG